MSAVAGLLGGAAITISVVLNDQAITRNSGTAAYFIKADGTVRQNASTGTTLQTWLLSGTASQAEVYAEQLYGGGNVGGTFNTWLPVTGDLSWSGTDAGIRLSIRQVGTGTILDTADVSLATIYSGGA